MCVLYALACLIYNKYIYTQFVGWFSWYRLLCKIDFMHNEFFVERLKCFQYIYLSTWSIYMYKFDWVSVLWCDLLMGSLYFVHCFCSCLCPGFFTLFNFRFVSFLILLLFLFPRFIFYCSQCVFVQFDIDLSEILHHFSCVAYSLRLHCLAAIKYK